MSGFAKGPRLPRTTPQQDDYDYIGRACRAFDESAEHGVFREPERVTPGSLALTIAAGLVLFLVAYLVLCGMYALGGAL